jgi:hypothetical protein
MTIKEWIKKIFKNKQDEGVGNSYEIIKTINNKIINDDRFESYENNANKIIEEMIKNNLSFEVVKRFTPKKPGDIEYGNYRAEYEIRIIGNDSELAHKESFFRNDVRYDVELVYFEGILLKNLLRKIKQDKTKTKVDLKEV